MPRRHRKKVARGIYRDQYGLAAVADAQCCGQRVNCWECTERWKP